MNRRLIFHLFVILQGFRPVNKNQFSSYIKGIYYSTIIFRITVRKKIPEKSNTKENFKVSKGCAKVIITGIKNKQTNKSTNQPTNHWMLGSHSLSNIWPLISLLGQQFSKLGVYRNQLENWDPTEAEGWVSASSSSSPAMVSNPGLSESSGKLWRTTTKSQASPLEILIQ